MDPALPVPVVWESAHLVAVDKPAGMLSIPGRQGVADPRPCALHELARTRPGKIWIVHRLDVDVSGLLLFARSAEAHRTLCGHLEHHRLVKVYEAWTEGRPPTEPAQVWESFLVRGRRRVWEAARGRWSRTEASYRGGVTWDGAPLLEWKLRPTTGRTHQLRCHLASRGWPVAGDRVYGSQLGFLPGAIALRAVRLDLGRIPETEREQLGLPPSLAVPGGAAIWRGGGGGTPGFPIALARPLAV